MNNIIKKNIDQIKELCVNHHVNSLYAFGSVCTDKFTDSSDIDLLISFEKMDHADYADNYFHVADQLENILHRSVDLLTDKSLSNPFFIESINQNKLLIYGQ